MQESIRRSAWLQARTARSEILRPSCWAKSAPLRHENIWRHWQKIPIATLQEPQKTRFPKARKGQGRSWPIHFSASAPYPSSEERDCDHAQDLDSLAAPLVKLYRPRDVVQIASAAICA